VEGFNNFVDAEQWSNVLGVVELLFCIPLSSGHLERVFPQLKFIKNNCCINLIENRLVGLIVMVQQLIGGIHQMPFQNDIKRR